MIFSCPFSTSTPAPVSWLKSFVTVNPPDAKFPAPCWKLNRLTGDATLKLLPETISDAPADDNVDRLVAWLAPSKVTVLPEPIVTAATFAPSGIAPPVQFAADDQLPVAPPVQLTDGSWVIEPPIAVMVGALKL